MKARFLPADARVMLACPPHPQRIAGFDELNKMIVPLTGRAHRFSEGRVADQNPNKTFSGGAKKCSGRETKIHIHNRARGAVYTWTVTEMLLIVASVLRSTI